MIKVPAKQAQAGIIAGSLRCREGVSTMAHRARVAEESTARLPVYFVSDSTGITAKTLGNALLAHFPSIDFDRRVIPFLETPGDAEDAVRRITAEPGPRLVFMTVWESEVAAVLSAGLGSTLVDLLGEYLTRIGGILGVPRSERPERSHGVGDLDQYHARMRAVEFAVEHDDAQSVRKLDRADLIVIGPSRCGKTPLALYLALQHGLRVANYPLTEDDIPGDRLPETVQPHVARCIGLTNSPWRLSQLREQRRPGSAYASTEQCRRELRWAESQYKRYGIPALNSQSRSVEEIASQIFQLKEFDSPAFAAAGAEG